jgi:hypothetical protein
MIGKEEIEKLKNQWAADGIESEISRRIDRAKGFLDALDKSVHEDVFGWNKIDLAQRMLSDVVTLRKEWEKIKGIGNYEDGERS